MQVESITCLGERAAATGRAIPSHPYTLKVRGDGGRVSGPCQPMMSEQAKVMSNFAVAGPAIGLVISGALMPSPVTV